jgi:AcrR family transcriptional regulator
MSDRRDDLRKEALAWVLEHGVASLSLRPLAAALGTSARLLVYHFGSREGLVTAVMDELRASLQASLAEAARVAPAADEHPLRTFWRSLTRRANRPRLRLLLEVQVLALQDPKAYGRYVDRTSTSWLEAIEAVLPASSDRRARATLYAAVVDGLMLELLATGDERRTSAALDVFLGMQATRRTPARAGHR